MLLVGQINSLALTDAVFHKDGCVILTMTVVMAPTSKDAPQVGTSCGQFFFLVLGSFLYCIWLLFSVALGEYAENLIVLL